MNILDGRSFAISQDLDTHATFDGVTVRGNDGGDRIQLQGGTLSENRTWDFGGLPVHLSSDLTIGENAEGPVTLTITPGSVIKLPTSGAITANPGVLRAEGTADNPIVFTSFNDDTIGGDSNGDGAETAPARGAWESINLFTEESLLQHTEVRYAGNNRNPGNAFGFVPAVRLDASATLDNVTISQSDDRGVALNVGNPTLRSVNILDGRSFAISQDLDTHATFDGVTVRGNEGGDRIELQGGTLTESRTWDFGGLPAHLSNDLTIGENAEGPVTLTITPGSVIKLQTSGAITANPGALRAEGTADNPIVFTSFNDDTIGGDSNGDGAATAPAPGAWESINLSTEASSLQHTEVRYAGNSRNPGNAFGFVPAVRLDAAATLSDLEISSSDSWAMTVRGDTTVAIDSLRSLNNVGGILVDDGTLTVTDSDFLGGERGISVDSGETATVSGSSFVGQSTFGAGNLGSDPANANFDGNYWGSAAGPHDPSAADGVVNDNPLGTTVTDFVSYADILTSPPRPLGLRVIELQRLDENELGQERLLVTFDSPLQVDALDASEFVLSGPTSVSVATVNAISDRSVEVTLSGAIDNAGSFVLSVGPRVLGAGGLAMDQDLDGVLGEATDDVFRGSFVVDRTGPRVVSQTPDGQTESVLASIDLTFNEPIDPQSITREDITLLDPATVQAIENFDPNGIIDGFRVRGVQSTAGFSNITDAEAILADPSRTSRTVEENTLFIDYGTGGNFANNRLTPLETTGVDINNFVLEATATISIPTAGRWTFAVASDDGYRLTIGDFAEMEFATGRPIRTDVMTFDVPAPGEYPLRLVMFELTGLQGFELSAAEGEFADFDPESFRLIGDVEAGGLSVNSSPVPPRSPIPTLSVFPLDIDNTQFRVTFPPQTIDQVYELRVGPNLTDVAGNALNQNNNGINGEETDQYIRSIEISRNPLRIISQSPTGTLNGALESLEVEFNFPIDEGSFSTDDVRAVGPGGRVSATSIDRLDATRYRINFERTTEDGEYEFVIGPNITDLAGTPLDSDQDAVPGELDDQYRGTLTIAGGGPFISDSSLSGSVPAPVSEIEVTFSEPIRQSSFTLDDVQLQGPDGPLEVGSLSFVEGTTFQIAFESITSAGSYSLVIGPEVADFAGTQMDQNRDGVAGTAEDAFILEFSIDDGGPRVTSTTLPETLAEPIGSFEVTFDEDIDPDTLSSDDVQLIGPEGPVNASVAFVSDSLNVLRLSGFNLTTPGEYTFSIGPNLADLTGNAMNQDGDATFGEAEEDRFTTTFTLAPADLVISNVVAPAESTNGEQITITWTVENVGDAAIDATQDRVVLSLDDIQGNGDDIDLGTFLRNMPLGPGESYEGSLVATVPFGIEGEYRVVVFTDNTRQVFELDEDNNQASASVTVGFTRPPADLILDAIQVSESGSTGNPIDVTWRVRNDGTAVTDVDSWIDRVYLSSDPIRNSNDVRLGDIARTGALEADASYTAQEEFIVPANLTPGEYFVIVQTDATNRLSEPAAENNNIIVSEAIAITVAPLPDLAATNVRVAAGQTPTSGETFTLEWAIENDGQAAATGTWTDAVYLSADDQFDGSDTLLGELAADVSELAVGGTLSRQLDVLLPEGLFGNQHFIVVPDANNTIREGDGEGNGVGVSDTIEVALFPYADLTVTSVVAPELIIGDPVDLTVTWTVENVGDGPGRATEWTDRVVLSQDETLGNRDDIVLGDFTHIGQVPVGSSYDRTEIIPLANATNGRFFVFVETNANNEVFELEDNEINVGSPDHPVDVAVQPYSDLRVESVTTEGFPTSGETISVTWSIANRGIATTNTDTWLDRIFISSDPTGRTGLREIGSTVRGGAIAVDDFYTRTAEVIIPRDTDGEHYIFVRTNGPFEFIFDGNDEFGGNQGRSEVLDVFFVPPPPTNLRVTEVSLGGLTEALDGTQVEVTWTVRNDGPEDTETGWSDRLFLQATDSGTPLREFGSCLLYTSPSPRD